MSWEAGNKEKSSKSSSFFNRVKEKPSGYYFRKIDSYDIPIHIGKVNLFQLNLFRDDAKLRKAILPLIAFASILWAVQGWDSSIIQIEYFFKYLPSYLMGGITWSRLVSYYMEPYGEFVHYSAFIIYMLFFVGISKYLRDKLEIVNSQNVMASICFVALSVGLFEYFWNISFCFLQNQPWVLSFQWPQAQILLQNLAMISVGLIFVIGIDRKAYRFNLNKWTILCLSATVASVLIWYFYGVMFPIQTISVPVEGSGIWQSTPYFPQTVYTIDTNVLDRVAAGEQFWVQNNFLHLVNTLTKVFMTLTLYSFLRLKRRSDLKL